MVNYRVSFTKHLYGKLKYNDYKPEKRHDWPTIDALIATPGIASTNEALVRERSLLGFKLTCAFELMSQHVKLGNCELGYILFKSTSHVSEYSLKKKYTFKS